MMDIECPFAGEARPVLATKYVRVEDADLNADQRRTRGVDLGLARLVVDLAFDADGRRASSVHLVGVPADADLYVYGTFTMQVHDEKQRLQSFMATQWLRSDGLFWMHALDRSRRMTLFSGTVMVFGAPVRNRAPRANAIVASPALGLSNLRQYTALCDVVLRAAGANFRAHKVLLSARSSVFEAAFTQEPDVKEVGVPVNCSAETFEIFLDGVYSGTLPDLRPSVHELILVLQLVDEYEVESLRSECIAQLVSVDVRGALTVLRAGLEKSFVPEAVTSKVITMVMDNWDDVADTQQWSDLCADHPHLSDIVSAFLARES